jgi:hypothetical protein
MKSLAGEGEDGLGVAPGSAREELDPEALSV